MSKIIITSDVHVGFEEESRNKTYLLNFLKVAKEKEVSKVIFMGDVFDFMVGQRSGYLKEFDYFYNEVLELVKVKKVVFIEGNHDFHLERMFKKFISKRIGEKYLNNFTYIKDVYQFENYLVLHGDQLDHENMAFKRWKKTYRSLLFRLLVNYLFPFRLIIAIGRWATSNSRHRSARNFDFEKYRERYRAGARYLLKGKEKMTLVSGHTHIREFLPVDSNTFVNMGFPVDSQEYIEISNDKLEFKKVVH